MILIAYRHGLHASELVSLEWSQGEFRSGNLHVARVKNGSPSVHPIQAGGIVYLLAVRTDHVFGLDAYAEKLDSIGENPFLRPLVH